MNASLFKCNKKVNDAFGELMKSADYGYVEVGIDFKENELIIVGSDLGMSKDDVFPSIKKLLKPKNHQLFVVKDPFSDKNLFKVVHFGSDGSAVKTRMIFASAREPLKTYLGTSSFSEDFFFSTIDECQESGMLTSADDLDARTDEEKLAQEALDDQDVLPVSTQVIQSLPIKVNESAKEIAIKFKNGQCKAAIFSLGKKQSVDGAEIDMDAKIETDTDAKVEKGDEKSKVDDQLTNIRATLNKVEEPRYVLFKFKRDKSVFLYYCPEKAERNLKFTYSTCKVNIIEFLKIAEIPVDLKLEEDQSADVNVNNVLQALSPRTVEAQKFAKPAMPNRKRRPKTKKSKAT